MLSVARTMSYPIVPMYPINRSVEWNSDKKIISLEESYRVNEIWRAKELHSLHLHGFNYGPIR